MRGIAVLVLVAVTTAPAAAQWHIGFEISTTHYRGSARDTANSGGPESFRPANATLWGARIDRVVGRARVGVQAAYARLGLTGAGQGLVVTDNSTGRLLEGQLLVNFQVVGQRRRRAARIRAARHLALRRGTGAALPALAPHRRIIAGTSLSLTSLLNAGMSVSSTAFIRSSCTCSAAANSLNTCSDCDVGAASALPTTPASAAILLFSRIG